MFEPNTNASLIIRNMSSFIFTKQEDGNKSDLYSVDPLPVRPNRIIIQSYVQDLRMFFLLPLQLIKTEFFLYQISALQRRCTSKTDTNQSN